MLLISLFIILSGVGVAFLLNHFGITLPCLFNKLTGLECPGCGNTRAVLSILKLDIKGAFHYNLMFLPEILYIAYVYVVCCRSYIKGGSFRYYSNVRAIDIICLVAFVGWGIVRNFI